MNNNISGDPLFNMTSCPDVNEFIEQVRAFYAMEITDDEFKESWEKLDNFRRQVRNVLAQQLKCNVLSPIKKKETDNIQKRLESAKSALEEIYLYFKDGKREHIESGLERCKRYFEEMFASAAAIRKEEEGELQKYSKAPLQNELMRIGYDVLDGKLPAKVFGEKLSALKTSLKNYYASCEEVDENDSQSFYFSAHRDEIKSAVKSYVKALEEAEQFLKTNDRSVLKKGLEKSAKAAEILVMHQENMTNAKRTKSCFKCGAENDFSAKYCASCNAVIPEMV